MKSILDPTFRYTSAINTDVGKTFARIYREQAKSDKRDALARQQAERQGAEDNAVVHGIFNQRRVK